MKTSLAEVMRFLLPARSWTYLHSVRARNQQRRWLNDHGVLDRARNFARLHGSSVLHGPFAGMKYPQESILSRHSVPMLLGSYESELHEIIQAALEYKYQQVIDVGSAEGYYAVGFALKGKSPVLAFDADPRELALCKEMARINAVTDRLTARNWCSPESLRSSAAGGRCFVLSDCEGYESVLFDDETVEALRKSDVLVEIHGNAYEPLLTRFSRTHGVRTLVSAPRSADDYPELADLAGDAPLAIVEHREPGQCWIYASTREPLAT